jgi:hypothetical protein
MICTPFWICDNTKQVADELEVVLERSLYYPVGLNSARGDVAACWVERLGSFIAAISAISPASLLSTHVATSPKRVAFLNHMARHCTRLGEYYACFCNEMSVRAATTPPGGQREVASVGWRKFEHYSALMSCSANDDLRLGM